MKSLFWIPVCTALLGALGMWIFSVVSVPITQGILFGTLVSADRESSVSEKESATNFFAETIVGWTHSPAFRTAVLTGQNGDFSAQKQERQNMVFTITAPDEIAVKNLSEALTHGLNAQLADVNRVSETVYKIIFSPVSVSVLSPRMFLRILSGAIFGVVFGIFCIPLAQWAKRRTFFK